MIHWRIALSLLLIGLQVSSVVSIIQGSSCRSNESFNYIALVRTRHHHCTGTLISSDWIITSASCLTSDVTEMVRPEHVFVQAGTLVDCVSKMSDRLRDDSKYFKPRQKRFADFIDAVEFEKISGVTAVSNRTKKPGSYASTAFTSTRKTEDPSTRKNYKPFNIRFLHLSYDREAKTEKSQVNISAGNVLFSHTALVKVNMSEAANMSGKLPAHNTVEMSKYVRNVTQIHLCPSYNLDSTLLKKCDLALLKLNRPYRRSGRISWLPIGNGAPSETPFYTHLCGWGQRENNVHDQASSQKVVKNFALDVQILPPAHCPPSRKETQGIYCLMTSSRGHPCVGDEGLPLVINTGAGRVLLGVGHGSEPIVVYRRRRQEGGDDRNKGRGDTEGEGGNGSNEKWSDERRRNYMDSDIHSCGRSDRYYIFTNICYHLDWIHQVIPELSKQRNTCNNENQYVYEN